MVQTNLSNDWKGKALQEITSVKRHFIQKHGWQLNTVDGDDHIALYVRLTHSRHPERIRMLRLVYGPGFPNERPREDFVNPKNPGQEGIEFWIDDGERAFKRGHNPPVICLEGTWGFHRVLHRERDPLRANLNKLLLEIQSCFDQTP